MRNTPVISLIVAILLGAGIYFFANRVPPAPETAANEHEHHDGDGHDHSHDIAPITPDSVLAQAHRQMPEHAVEDIKVVEAKIAAEKNEDALAPLYAELAKLWQQHKQVPAAAIFYAKEAKLVNSEKKLNFAAQLFSTLMRKAPSASYAAWEAQEAIDLFERSLKVNPDNDTVKLALAAVYLDGTDQPMSGVALLRDIVAEKPNDIPANLMLGQMSVKSGQLDKAVERFTTVLNQEPENIEGLLGMAEAYKNKGDKAKAIELLEKCKQIMKHPEFSKDVDEYIKTF